MEYVPYAALLVAFSLIYIPRFVASAEMKRLEGGYDNHDPRAQQQQLAGRGRRAIAAHQNSLEAFPPFAAGVLAAIQRGGNSTVLAALVVAFVVVRTGYIVAYLDDKASLRSGMWSLGMLVITALFVLALVGR